MKKNRRRGKEAEKMVAKFFSGLRIGILGGADVITDRFVVEVKEREKIPAIIRQGIEQAEKYASGKIPVFVLHKLGSCYDNDYVILKMKNFLEVIDVAEREGQKNQGNRRQNLFLKHQ